MVTLDSGGGKVGSRRAKFEEVMVRLLSDKVVVRALRKRFGEDADRAIRELEAGNCPEIKGEYLPDFLFDLLMNDARSYMTYMALGDFGEYPIQILGLGGVHYYHAPDFERSGFYESVDDAARDVEADWGDAIVSVRDHRRRSAEGRPTRAKKSQKPLESDFHAGAQSNHSSDTDSDFVEQILQILERTEGVGMYAETNSPSEQTYHLSWATGMGSMAFKMEYERMFGDLPHWVKGLHPSKRFSLCKLSTAKCRRLPDSRPS